MIAACSNSDWPSVVLLSILIVAAAACYIAWRVTGGKHTLEGSDKS